MKNKKKKKSEKCYVYNIFTTNSKYVTSCYKLLLMTKNNLSGGFKLELVTT